MFSIVLPTLNPVALSVGPFNIHWYALSYVVGLLAGTLYISKLEKSLNMCESKVARKKLLEDMFFMIALGIMIGGRLGYVLFYNFSYYFTHPAQILYVWEGGMSFHGALIGSIVALIVMAKRKKLPLLSLFDLAVCAAPIGIFLGRVANFINQELQGRPTTMPWGVIFNGETISRHPSEIYEALLEGLLLLLILYVLWKKYKVYKSPGYLGSCFLMLYGTFRIICEFFREPDPQIGYFFDTFTLGQILSFLMILAGFMGLSILQKKYEQIRVISTSDSNTLSLDGSSKCHPKSEPSLPKSCFQKDSLKVLQSPNLLGYKHINHAFFTRQGGVSKGDFSSLNVGFATKDEPSNINCNRQLALGYFGLPQPRLCTLQQESASKVVVVNKKNLPRVSNTPGDGLVTNEPEIALGVYTADCVPLLLADSKNSVVAAVHAGHQGAFQGVVGNTVAAMLNLGAEIQHIAAALGPAIQQTSYQVQKDFYQRLTGDDPEVKKLFTPHKASGHCFALPEYVIYLLYKLKINNVYKLPYDTFSSPHLFFSHRYSMLHKHSRGLQLSSIVIR